MEPEIYELYYQIAFDVSRGVKQLIAGIMLALLCRHFMVSTKAKRRVWMVGVVYFAVVAVFLYIEVEVYSFTAYLSAFSAAFLVLCCLEKGNRQVKFLLCYLFFSVRALAAYVARDLRYFSEEPIERWIILKSGMSQENIWRLCFLSFCLFCVIECVLVALILWLICKGIKRIFFFNRNEMEKKEMLLLMLPSILGIVYYIGSERNINLVWEKTGMYMNDMIPEYDIVEIVIQIILLAAIMSMLWLYQKLKQEQAKKQSDRLLLQEVKSMRAHIEEVERLHDDLRGLRHDMRNHISVLQGLMKRGAFGQAQAYLDSLGRSYTGEAGKTGAGDAGRQSEENEAGDIGRRSEEKGTEDAGRWSEEEGTWDDGGRLDEKRTMDIGRRLEEKGTRDVRRRLEEEGTRDVGRQPEEEGTMDVGRRPEEKRTRDVGRQPEEEGTRDVGRRLEEEGTWNAGRWPEEKGTWNVGRRPDEKGTGDVGRWPEEEGTENAGRRSEEEGTGDVRRRSKRETLKYDAGKGGQQPQIMTGNPVTDVILSEHCRRIMEAGMMFEADFHYPDSAAVDAFDLSVILDNALTNALEAAPRGGQIRIRSFREHHAYLIVIENTFEGELAGRGADGLLMTTKRPPEEHGFGLRHMKTVVEHYHGDMAIEQKGNMVQLNVMLCI